VMKGSGTCDSRGSTNQRSAASAAVCDGTPCRTLLGNTLPPKEDDGADVRREAAALVERDQLWKAVELEVLHGEKVRMLEDLVHDESTETMVPVLRGDDDIEDEDLEDAVGEDSSKAHEVHRFGFGKAEDVIGMVEHAPDVPQRATLRPPLLLIELVK